MHQRSAGEPGEPWQQGYRDEDIPNVLNDPYTAHTSGQKLQPDEDESFATLLARKLKEELRDELAGGKDPTIGYRVALAIVSICILVPLFLILVFALSLGLGNGGGGIVLGYASVFICITIISINAYFNRVISPKSKSGPQKEK
ncbi:hypothetical protein [Dictyobacter arantiisoli]|uniref:Uncharacterized protein n=1 Tax=Dictyobacter arantiisoli TaxID=2014874 RepID=A0A5A5TDV8_9CHLR|nr:hypothetical protein [Dictyobacter arantiisoli]GCF09179.1 hypothetical protein KDI_27430 [Dictyobacter arantiisoli]